MSFPFHLFKGGREWIGLSGGGPLRFCWRMYPDSSSPNRSIHQGESEGVNLDIVQNRDEALWFMALITLFAYFRRCCLPTLARSPFTLMGHQ